MQGQPLQGKAAAAEGLHADAEMLGKPHSKVDSGCCKSWQALTDPLAITVDMFKAISMECSIEEGSHLFNQYFAPTAIVQGALPGQRDMSVQEFKEWYRDLKHSMPDVNMVLYDITQGVGTQGQPIVWARWSKLGRFIHPFMGIPATHTRVAMTGVLVCRFTKGGERPLIDYCELFQDTLGALSTMGLNFKDAVPERLARLLPGVQGQTVPVGVPQPGEDEGVLGGIGSAVSHLADRAKEVLGMGGK